MSEKSNFNLSDLGDALPTFTAGLSAQDRAGLVSALKGKLRSLTGQHSDVMENLGPKVKRRVEALKEIQNQHDEFEAQYFEERAALEAKYQKLYQPLYTKRYEIVNGIVDVDIASTDNTQNATVDETTAKKTTSDELTEEKGVPAFWLTAMKSNEVLADEIQENDEEALTFLKDIKWSRLDNSKGFKLEFFFDSNPFFKNAVLTKTYHMIDDDEPILEKAIGTEIEWFPGKCLTQKILKKKPKKGAKNAKPITKTETCESFFNFFNPPEVPEEDEDIDEKLADELQTQMEQDYDIGSTIRDKIIPHAVSWFTGEAAQDEFSEFLDEDEDEEDDEDEETEEEDEEDDDEEDDDDEDEEDSNTKKSSASRTKSGKDVQVDQPPECKQQ